jgi:hypothetical protein
MTQDKLDFTNPTAALEWEDSDFWGKTSLCRRFSIRGETLNGKTEYVVWRRGADGRVIPKCLGRYHFWEDAVACAEDAKYGDPPKRNKMYDWKSDAEDWK